MCYNDYGDVFMVTKSINERIVEEILPQIRNINENKLKYRESNLTYGSKLLGNVIATTIKKYIENIINYYGLDYSVSLNNSFIGYCPIEWDLIIYKKGLLPDNNIISEFDVIAVIEFKTSGTVDVKYKERTKQEFLSLTFDKAFQFIKELELRANRKINFGYITFSTDIDWFLATKEYFDKQNGIDGTAFAFLDDKELEKGHIVTVEGCDDFEKYIFNLLKERSNDVNE